MIERRFEYEAGGKIKGFKLRNSGLGIPDVVLEDAKARLYPVKEHSFKAILKHHPEQSGTLKKIEHLMKQIEGLSLIRTDLMRVKNFVAAFRSKVSDSIQDALAIAGTIIYMKSFTGSTDRIRLKDDIFPAKQRQKHAQLKLIRDKYFAHSNLTHDFEFCRSFLIFDEGQFVAADPMVLTLRLKQVFKLLPSLVNRAEKYVSSEITEKKKILESTLNKLNSDVSKAK